MTVTAQEVTEDEAGIRLDRWFRRHHPQATQGIVQKLCRTGQVRVDGRRAEAATRLSPGQKVRVPPLPGAPPPARAPRIDPEAISEVERMVVHIDDSVIVLNKPHGLPVQGGPGIIRHLDGMMEGFRQGAADKPRLVHRLDRDTSGLLVLARTAGVAARLAASFRSRAVEKTYWAVVAGRPSPQDGQVDLPLVKFGGLRGGERVAVAQPDEEGAARAISTYRTLDAAGRKLAWMELSPLTGRTHQLRVHAVALGTPIVGDRMYGGEKSQVEGLADRLHLHARRLCLPHPLGGILEVEADLPAHMRDTFSLIGFQAPPAAPPLLR
jgi:23S rRNA pseudouridine955/2504/2580 synthase